MHINDKQFKNEVGTTYVTQGLYLGCVYIQACAANQQRQNSRQQA